MLWQDFTHKLADQVLLPLNTYQGQFPEMRKKIDKRGRKLVDYDSQRHSFQALQTNMKKRDEAKIAKGREQLEEAKRTYEIMNSELHDELPALYDSRILFLVTNLQSLFNAENVFHGECAKVFGELEAIVDKLATDSQRGSYSVKKTNGASLPRPSSIIKNSPQLIINNRSPTNSARAEDPPQSPTKKDSPTKTEPTPPSTLNSNENCTPPSTPTKLDEKPLSPPSPPLKTVELNGTSTPDGKKSPSPEPTATDKQAINNDTKHVEELYDIPVGASTENLPPGVLYRVKATYKYNKEDVDELSFEVGEIISVVEYDDPEEQEEGWLMGIKDNGEKGMFPANFTRPL
uniref:Myc box-dependent-interacting protein n=2 Tax=Anoplophora glabripennis TaxID=217634 RepID=V5H1R4_ANOGL